jgi:hypothetical protein
MATEKQIAANRANAKRSTGPETVRGKRVSSRNAFRHGLSCPLQPRVATSPKVQAIARALAGEGANDMDWAAAVAFVNAQCELLKIQTLRREMLGSDITSLSTRQLHRLAALDRYERYSHTRCRRASQMLEN